MSEHYFVGTVRTFFLSKLASFSNFSNITKDMVRVRSDFFDAEFAGCQFKNIIYDISIIAKIYDISIIAKIYDYFSLYNF